MSGQRALGANAVVAGSFESSYGVNPGSGAVKLAIVAHNLGAEQNLISSDLLGLGREPQDPTDDVVNNVGDVTVPVDARQFGLWLKLLFGAPTTTGAPAAANGILTTTGNFADGETVTIGSKVYTLQAALTEADGHVHIGASASASITNLYNAINASGGTSGTDYAAACQPHPTVVASSKTASLLTVSAKIGGPAQNSIATTETSASASWGAGTLTGGTVATHVFKSGASSLPSMSIEIGNPEVPSYSNNYGARANTLKISMARSGLLNAVMSLICKGESAPAGSSAAGALATILVQRFAQATGSITRDGSALGSVMTAEITVSNMLDPVETIQPNGEIEDADPGVVNVTIALVTKFNNLTLYNLATNNTPTTLAFSWTFGDFSLTLTVPRAFLPRVKRPVSGPKGIQASYNLIGSGALGNSFVATLVNDVASYA